MRRPIGGATIALLAVLHALALPTAASACDCFPPELRIKTAQEALQSARLAVYGRVVAVADGGSAKLLVLESFKGPTAGSTVDLAAGTGQCAAQALVVGEETLLLSFEVTPTACDRHSPEHYLLPTFRFIATKAR